MNFSTCFPSMSRFITIITPNFGLFFSFPRVFFFFFISYKGVSGVVVNKAKFSEFWPVC